MVHKIPTMTLQEKRDLLKSIAPFAPIHGVMYATQAPGRDYTRDSYQRNSHPIFASSATVKLATKHSRRRMTFGTAAKTRDSA
jgi:hypothetical protein